MSRADLLEPSAGQRVAATLADTDVPVVTEDEEVAAVLERLRSHRYASVASLAVLRGQQLVGVAAVEDVLAAPDGTRMQALVRPATSVVSPGEQQELVAWLAAERGESSVAVAEEGRFLGFISAAHLVGVLLGEHREDMARLSGFLHRAQAARAVSEEPVLRRLWHRLPWLLVGLAGALAAAKMMEGFEATLRANVIVAFFLPGIVYLADAVGTQTETLIVRGLSVGVSVRAVVVRELLTGAFVGVALALAFVAAGSLIWGDALVVTAVSLAVLAACGTATVVAMALPAAIQALGLDPAFGSGPLATVVQDLLSILLYLLITTALLA